MRTVTEFSAGGVVHRPAPSGPEVCLIATNGFRYWQLPKGLVEHGEPPEETAAREVREETGLSAELEREIGPIEYWYVRPDYNRPSEQVRVHKRVVFYLFRYVSGSTEDHDDEVDDARWFPASDAVAALSFENEREALRKAVEMISP